MHNMTPEKCYRARGLRQTAAASSNWFAGVNYQQKSLITASDIPQEMYVM